MIEFMKSISLGSAEDLKRQIRKSSKLKGRQPEDKAIQELNSLKGLVFDRRDLLIENLHVLNDAYHGLQERHLVALAVLMKISMAEVYEVATFYHHFDILKANEQHPAISVRVCNSVSCEMAGSQALIDRLKTLLGLKEVKIESVPCVGRCEQAPVAVVEQYPVIFASPEKIADVVKQKIVRHPTSKKNGAFKLSDHIEQSVTKFHDDEISPEYCGYEAYIHQGGYQVLKSIVSGARDPEIVIKAMEDSGLRGLGGAGFPAGRKWRIVKDQIAPKLLAVNIDEGEPGTFKDRTYLERDPHRFLEGMLIATQIVGIEACYIYLRDEYHGCRQILEDELAKLISNPPCALPKIELRRGAGAYICGEESAMIESIEGKRGEPRMRPPYIAQIGLFGRPTLEHNFETLYWIRDILEKGSEWFSGFGRHGRKGLRSFSVSGRVKEPGVKLAPAGITVQELIDEYCGGMQEGHEFYAYLPGGASGGILPASMNQIPLDFDTLQPYGCFIGSAAVMILSQKDQARDAALNVMKFFEHESCGQCTPCRVGTAKAATLMQAKQWDQSTLNDLSQVMVDASICGLGQAAPNSIQTIVKYFPQEVK